MFAHLILFYINLMTCMNLFFNTLSNIENWLQGIILETTSVYYILYPILTNQNHSTFVSKTGFP